MTSFESEYRDINRLIHDGSVKWKGSFQHVLPISEILSFRPKNSDLSDEWWKVTTEIFGVSGSYARMFRDFEEGEMAEGRVPRSPSIHENPEMWYTVRFGKAGRKAIRAAGHNHAQFAGKLFSEEWELKELGLFGKWFEQLDLPQGLTTSVLRSYLSL